jgi:hypothetical protein
VRRIKEGKVDDTHHAFIVGAIMWRLKERGENCGDLVVIALEETK